MIKQTGFEVSLGKFPKIFLKFSVNFTIQTCKHLKYLFYLLIRNKMIMTGMVLALSKGPEHPKKLALFFFNCRHKRMSTKALPCFEFEGRAKLWIC